MKKTAFGLAALAAVAGTPALAAPHYMFCFGGGRPGLYYSTVFAVPEGTKGVDKAKAFAAFVTSKYGQRITPECHSNQTQAVAAADRKMRQDNDQTSKFTSKIIETGWAGT